MAYYNIFDNKKSGFKKIIVFSKLKENPNWDLTKYIDQEIEADPNNDLQIKKFKNASLDIAWPKWKDLRYVNRSFSFWRKNDVIYFNSWSPGSNKPPGTDFIEIEKEFFRIYKSLITK